MAGSLVILVGLVGMLGWVLGIAGFVVASRLDGRLRGLEQRVARLRTSEETSSPTGDVRGLPAEPAAPPPPETGPEPAPEPVPVPEPTPIAAAEPASAPAAARTYPEAVVEPSHDFERRLGTRWIIWAGAAIFLVGLGLALKYTYDHDLIGPRGRLAIGTMFGLAALGVGEWFRRITWKTPGQAFTGIGYAALYICIYFSFQVYALSTAGVSMALAVLVTLAAVTTAVRTNAVSMAILAVLGGFASPVVLSTGENHPYQLFTYLVFLNLVALGAACFRRWRSLGLVCFGCTALLYQAWYHSYYDAATEFVPALLYTTVFYIIFLAVPTVHGLLRKMPEKADALALVVLSSLHALWCYYEVLHEDYRTALTLVVLGQAALLLALRALWIARLGKGTQVGECLLVIALGLITLAVPIQLRVYAIPMAWAAQGVVYLYLGARSGKLTLRAAGCAALFLALTGLIGNLPLHTEAFTPLFNQPFAAWAWVVAAAAVAGTIVHMHFNADDPLREPMGTALMLAAIVLGCIVLTMETGLYWYLRRGANWQEFQGVSLCLLWSAIPMALAGAARRRQSQPLACVSWAALVPATVVAFYSVLAYPSPFEGDAAIPLLNAAFLPRLAIILACWCCAWMVPKVDNFPAAMVGELWGHFLLAGLAVAELLRLSDHLEILSTDMALGVISAVWALHGCLLIFQGLRTRAAYRRYAGFMLFGIAAFKTVTLDTFMLEEVYRIVSWIGCGALLVGAALLYQRYSHLLMGDGEEPAAEKALED